MKELKVILSNTIQNNGKEIELKSIAILMSIAQWVDLHSLLESINKEDWPSIVYYVERAKRTGKAQELLTMLDAQQYYTHRTKQDEQASQF